MAVRIQVEEDAAAVARAAAEFIAAKAREAVAERGRCVMTLCGGSSIARVYEALAAQPDVDWPNVWLFWGDERFVEADNPYSNVGLVQRSLLARLPAQPRLWLPPTDAPTPAEGAGRYEAEIREALGGTEGIPVFDLCLNGMGPDGHTASLFPHSAALGAGGRLVAPNHAGLHPWVDRLTLTMPVLNAARCVLMVATGVGKAGTLRRVWAPGADTAELPSAALNPAAGELVWLLDRPLAEAAGYAGA